MKWAWKFFAGFLVVWFLQATCWALVAPFVVASEDRHLFRSLCTVASLLVYVVLVGVSRAWPYSPYHVRMSKATLPVVDTETAANSDATRQSASASFASSIPTNRPMARVRRRRRQAHAIQIHETQPSRSEVFDAEDVRPAHGSRLPWWLVVQVLVIASMGALVFTDRAIWHLVVADPRTVSELERRVADVESQGSFDDSDSQARSRLALLDAEMDRVSVLAAFGYATTLQDRQKLGADATSALFERCKQWVLQGGDFGTACH